MDTITNEENKVVEELKRRTINDVTPKMLEDPSLFYRFAKARDFSLVEAETMLRKHITWRKEMEIDTILTDYKPPEVLQKYSWISFIGFDKEGCCVPFYDSGRVDSKGMLNSVKNTDLQKLLIHSIEKDRENMIRLDGNGKKRCLLGKPILSPIFDFEGLTYAKAVNVRFIQTLGYLAKAVTDNYPEYLNVVSIINTPFYFAWLFTALKPFLPATVIRKIRIYGSDGWKEVLLENIDADILPAFLGGNRTDPDGNPLCETFILRCKPIPKSFYIQKRQKNLALESDAEKLTVMPFAKEEITFEIKEENSLLEWEFETNNRDIDFLLLFKGKTHDGLELVELIPKQRVDTCSETEKGCFKCEKLGTYIIVFDNSYSWIHSKEVYYKAGIKSPTNNESIKST